MKVLVIDDHLAVLRGCCDLLKGIGVGGVFPTRSLQDAVAVYRRHKPELIVLDLSFPSQSLGGLNFLHWMRNTDPRVRIVVLTMHCNAGIARRAIDAGANGFVTKSDGAEELLAAIRKVMTGGTYLSPKLAVDMAFDRGKEDAFGHLSLRELDTLKLIGNGTRYETIADHLHVSYKTVVNVVSSLKRKLKVRSLAELTRVAITGKPGAADTSSTTGSGADAR